MELQGQKICEFLIYIIYIYIYIYIYLYLQITILEVTIQVRNENAFFMAPRTSRIDGNSDNGHSYLIPDF